MPQVHTFSGDKLQPAMNPDLARTVSVKIVPSKTLAKGTVLGRVAASNLWDAYVDTTTTDPARAILAYDVVTDAGGLHYYGGQASSEQGQGEPSVPAYINGDFFDADLVGLDANGLTNLGGRIIFGDDLNDANAVVHIP
jgi:hypothetical protein